MKIVIALFCLIALSGFGSDAPFTYTVKELKGHSSQSQGFQNWMVEFVNKGKVPIKIHYIVKNQRQAEGTKFSVGPQSHETLEIKPGESDDDGGAIYTVYGTPPDIQAWVVGSGTVDSASSKPRATPPQNANPPANDPSNGSEALRQALIKAKQEATQGAWTQLLGKKSVSYRLVDPKYPQITMDIRQTFEISGTPSSPEVTVTGENVVGTPNGQNRYDSEQISTNPSRSTRKGDACSASYAPEARRLTFKVVNSIQGVTTETFTVGETGIVSFELSCPSYDWIRATAICK